MALPAIVGQYLAPAVLSMLASAIMNRGSNKAQEQATGQASELSQALMGMLLQQNSVDAPFRQGLLGAGGPLQQRLQSSPRLAAPTSVPVSNPYRNVRSATPTRGSSPLSQALSLSSGGGQRLNLRG